ncbi:MAG: hypothetical protein DIU78_004590 [Pseudomonadota bacterium]|nr:MAG: hypothetical protein DIU78_12155 [Pseudomonadota bacterium]
MPLGLAVLLGAPPAPADGTRERDTARPLRGVVRPRDVPAHDGVYGRFDGDLFLTLGAGIDVGGGARVGAVGRALLFHSAGVTLGYARALGEADVEQLGFVGIELRPLFLPRFALDLETNSPLVDLTLDSLALGVGGFFAEERSDSGRRRAGVEATLGFGVPLFAEARGPWIEARGALRPALHGPAGQVFVFLSWYEPLLSPLVD